MKKNISFLIKPTSYDCNLFCDYCFYRKTAESYPETSAHRMSIDTFTTLVKKAQKYNDRAAGYLWQGGEPMLMGLEFFEHTLTIQEKYRKPETTTERREEIRRQLLQYCKLDTHAMVEVLSAIKTESSQKHKPVKS